jgi:creatinine amidohydrolase
MIEGRRGIKVVLAMVIALAAVLVVYLQPRQVNLGSMAMNEPNPIPLSETLAIQKMTWMEVRDRVALGYTRVIVPTGGIEQNGPFVALNKHDVIAAEVSERSARSLGNTLVAPVVSFVFEGEHSPPTGHMRYPGTLSVSSDTFQRLMGDIVSSLAMHGFKEIVLVGDSFDTQGDLERVAKKYDGKSKSGAVVRYISGFYNYDDVRAFLKNKGIAEAREPFHEELAFTLQLMAIDPSVVRYDQRMSIGATTLGGVPLADKARLISLGQEILSLRVSRVVEAIRSGE